MIQHARWLRTATVILVASLLLVAAPTVCFAETAQDYVTSITVNAQLLPDPAGYSWWFNTPYPVVGFLASATVEPDTAHPVRIGGFEYNLSHSPSTLIPTPPTPGTGPWVAFAPNKAFGDLNGTPVADESIDLLGWVARNAPYAVTGGHNAIEGIWYLRAHSIASDQFNPAGMDHVAQFGIDVTPPAGTVKNLRPAGAISSSGVVDGKVCDFRWDNTAFSGSPYDELSGDAQWVVNLNGATVRSFRNVAAWPTATITLENLAPGKNTVEVACMDWAGNTGKFASSVVYSDPDVPTIAFTTPAGSVIGIRPTIKVNAQDKGGIHSVAYALDGVAIGTSTSAPYLLEANLAGFSSGTHTLTAVVTDLIGRTATATKVVTLDKTPLTITNFSRTPETFFPIKRDKYKDNSTISYSMNKAASVTLLIRSSNGSVVRSLTSSSPAGSHKFVWDGKWASDGAAHKGTYTYQLVASDDAGNSASTGRLKTTIKNYELKRVGKSKVKVIPR